MPGAECSRGRVCPSGIPRRVIMLQPLGCRNCPCFDLLAASIRKSGLEIENRCTDCPCFDLLAASIRKSGPEIKNRCTDCPCFGLLVASIRKSGPEIKNRCPDCPCFDLMAASIRKSGLEIGNRCSAIVPASRIARLRSRCRNGAASDSIFSSPQSIAVPPAAVVAALMSGPPAALSSSHGELPACRMTVAGAGGDRLPRRRHNPK